MRARARLSMVDPSAVTASTRPPAVTISPFTLLGSGVEHVHGVDLAASSRPEMTFAGLVFAWVTARSAAQLSPPDVVPLD